MLNRTLAISVSSALLLAGCAYRSGKPGTVAIEVWSGWTGQEAVAFKSLCDKFSAAHPGIQIHNLGGVTDNSKIIRSITAGVPPDCFTIWNTADAGPMAAYGAISNLDDEFRESGLRETDFVPGALPLCKYNGHFIGMPLLMDAYALFWNKDAFREAGLDPERPPATTRELMETARRLTAVDRKGEITRLGLLLPDTTLLCWVHGGDFLDKEGRPTADSPDNLRAYKYYRNLVNAMGGPGKVHAFGSGYGQGQGPNHPFFVGKVAMMISGEWIPSWCVKYAPRLEYGVAPVPYDESRPDRKGTTLISVNMLAIPAEAKHPKEAWEFLRWLQRPEVQTEFAVALNNVPNNRAALKSPELIPDSECGRNFGRFCQYAQHPNARGFPVSPVGQLYQDELGHATEFVLYGTKTPERALADVQTKLERELEKKRIR